MDLYNISKKEREGWHMMKYVYKFLGVYLFFAFTIGTLLEFEYTVVLAISMGIIIATMATVKYTRNILIDIYNSYILPNYYIVLGVLGPIHFYFSVDNIYIRTFCILMTLISTLMEIRYKVKGGDYTRWEL